MRATAEWLREFLDKLGVVKKAPNESSSARLAALLERSRPFLERLRLDGPQEPPTDLATAKLGALLATLRPPLANARSSGGFTNIWAIARLRRDELRNAAVLASLWNPGVCGRIAVDFLSAFLNRLPIRASLPTIAELSSGYIVRPEYCPLGINESRVDISLEGRDFVVLIEVKIDAAEGWEQLKRYDELLRTKARLLGKRPSLILLGPRAPLSGAAIHATWEDVSAAARIASRGRIPSQETFAEALLRQFAIHVRAFA
jgi:hypothetical protein